MAPWLAMSAASVVLPWVLLVTLGLGSLAEALAGPALWDGVWPVLLGGALFAALRYAGHLLPHPPEGDLIVVGRPLTAGLRAVASWMERIDRDLRRWPVAGISLLAVAVADRVMLTPA